MEPAPEVYETGSWYSGGLGQSEEVFQVKRLLGNQASRVGQPEVLAVHVEPGLVQSEAGASGGTSPA